MAYAVGIDVGGTTVKIGLFRDNGELLSEWEIPTRTENGGSAILPDIADSLQAFLADAGIGKEEIIGAGLGVPGPVMDDGIVRKCVNLGWGVFNVEEALSKLLDLPVKAGNDANVAALGEQWVGSGTGASNLVMVTLGTGVGGGIIYKGIILNGVNGAAGEFGHITVNPEEQEICGCGKRGCLEQYASANGIARLARRYLVYSDIPSVLRDGTVSAKTVFDAAKRGDAAALDIVEQFGDILGRHLAAVACVIDPEVFVIGGGVSKAGTIVTEVIAKYYKTYAFHASQDTPFRIASLGNRAGICGAARLAILSR